MHLHSVGQSSVQHGEDGQVCAQVRNHSTGGTLQINSEEAHCSLELQLQQLLNWLLVLLKCRH